MAALRHVWEAVMAHEQAPPILVTGAAGNVGSVGRRVVQALRRRGLPVRAFVHREDERAAALRDLGAEVVVGDLTHAEDVARAMDGCRRVFFLSLPDYRSSLCGYRPVQRSQPRLIRSQPVTGFQAEVSVRAAWCSRRCAR
jgi:NAD(P)H-binding